MRVTFFAILYVLVLSVAGCEFAESAKPREEKTRQDKIDCMSLREEIWPVLGKWLDSRPSDGEAMSSYDTVLVLDVEQRRVWLECGDGEICAGDLPEGYDWQIFHVTPNGTRELQQRCRLKLQCCKGRRNLCREVFLVRGLNGPSEGLFVDIRTLGPAIDVGAGQVVPTSYAFHDYAYRDGGDGRIASLLVD